MLYRHDKVSPVHLYNYSIFSRYFQPNKRHRGTECCLQVWQLSKSNSNYWCHSFCFYWIRILYSTSPLVKSWSLVEARRLGYLVAVEKEDSCRKRSSHLSRVYQDGINHLLIMSILLLNQAAYIDYPGYRPDNSSGTNTETILTSQLKILWDEYMCIKLKDSLLGRDLCNQHIIFNLKQTFSHELTLCRSGYIWAIASKNLKLYKNLCNKDVPFCSLASKVSCVIETHQESVKIEITLGVFQVIKYFYSRQILLTEMPCFLKENI